MKEFLSVLLLIVTPRFSAMAGDRRVEGLGLTAMLDCVQGGDEVGECRRSGGVRGGEGGEVRSQCRKRGKGLKNGVLVTCVTGVPDSAGDAG